MNNYEETAKRILTHFDNAEYENAAITIAQRTGTPRLISDQIAITLGIDTVRDNLPQLLQILFTCYGFNM